LPIAGYCLDAPGAGRMEIPARSWPRVLELFRQMLKYAISQSFWALVFRSSCNAARVAGLGRKLRRGGADGGE